MYLHVLELQPTQAQIGERENPALDRVLGMRANVCIVHMYIHTEYITYMELYQPPTNQPPGVIDPSSHVIRA